MTRRPSTARSPPDANTSSPTRPPFRREPDPGRAGTAAGDGAQDLPPATPRTPDTDRPAEAILRADLADHHQDVRLRRALHRRRPPRPHRRPLADDQDRHLARWLRHHDAR
ncbi:hypothetical protein GCM10018772_25290 [Streptomyces fumanus]|uniref:Uncharacterized protein n=1 Tax=Streptomyces fumanus TaxID=67302 RepID=A0A919AD36_9ACTN|nr:hypothetical protein GCM10018772_25290 [Streptomyces fumanus]